MGQTNKTKMRKCGPGTRLTLGFVEQPPDDLQFNGSVERKQAKRTH